MSVALLIQFLSVPAIAAVSNKNYGALPTLSMAAISPSGNLVAYRKVEGNNDFFIVYSREEKKIISAAHIGKLNPKHIYFIDEDKVVIIVSQLKRFLEYVGEHEISTAFVFDVKTKKFQQLLTPGNNIRLGQSGLGRVIAISPDKKTIYMPAYVGDNTEAPDYSLMKVDIESPRGPRVMHKGNYKTRDYFMDGDGNLLAKEVYSDSSDVHRLMVKEGNDWREIYSDTVKIMDLGFMGLTPDRKSLVVLDEDSSTERTGYYLMSLADGTMTATHFGRTDADIDNVITDINRVVYGVRYSGFNPSYKFIDPVLDKRMSEITTFFPDQSVWLADWSANWESILVLVEGSDSSGDYYLFTDGKPPVQLAASRPDIKAQDIHPIAVINIKARDGLIIPTLITIPNTKLEAMKNLPAVLLPHGGPADYDRIGFNWMAQAFANKGYLVIQPQFRGSTGFGLAHYLAGQGEWGKKMQDDLTDSLQLLVNKGYVDPARVCIVGASYGGYAALAGAAFTPDLYQCAVSVNGVSDLAEMLRTEKRDHGKSSWVVNYWEASMANGSASKEILNAISPINHVEKIKAPVLLIHGQNDEIVPVRQSKAMYKKLNGQDKEVVYKELKHESHYLESNETRLEMLESMVAFVEKYLGK